MEKETDLRRGRRIFVFLAVFSFALPFLVGPEILFFFAREKVTILAIKPLRDPKTGRESTTTSVRVELSPGERYVLIPAKIYYKTDLVTLKTGSLFEKNGGSFTFFINGERKAFFTKGYFEEEACGIIAWLLMALVVSVLVVSRGRKAPPPTLL